MTTQQIADSLNYNQKWHFKNLTYSFKSSKLPYESYTDYQGTQAVTPAMKAATHQLFDYIGSILDLTFTYTQDIGDIVLSSKTMQDATTLGYTYMPGSTTKNAAGDVYISALFKDTDFQKGGMGWSTILHELGHALGLDHPFGEGAYQGIDIHDTVMSYNPYQGYDFTGHYYATNSFTTYQSADILALQAYYGNDTTQTDDFYDLNSLLYSQKINGSLGTIQDNLYTIDDQSGINTISLANLEGLSAQYLNLNQGTQSIIINNEVHHYLSLSSNTIIQNAIGSQANDTITLNNQNNTIDGRSGYDIISITNQGVTRIDQLPNKLIISNPISGFDVLTNTEALYINDLHVNTDIYSRNTISYENHDDAVQISRLYLSVLDRLSDVDGLNYWLNEYENSHDLNAIANSFVTSNEFTTLYGQTQSDAEYINLLYHNILYRDADASGLSYWEENMQAGLSKADVLVSFSNSQEFITLTSVYFEDGLINTI